MVVEVTEDNIYEAAKIHSESWKESHKGFCSKEFVKAHTVERQLQYLRNEIKDGKVIYMLIDSIPVGIVSVKDSLIENLYVLPNEQGKGYGTELLKFAINKCNNIPSLWILNNNEKAYKMYNKHGFIKTGKENILSDELSEIEMKLLRKGAIK